ncbi:PASTA domain-containing protein [candidate division KSB1 bacterium]|nr:PASTA domain-containing protein [candidate division KSB1 bacterium]
MLKQNDRNRYFRRLAILIIGVFIFWTVLILRLVHIQLLNKRKYVDMGANQYTQAEELRSDRGVIYDRNMTSLALNRPVYSIGVDVRKLQNLRETARVLAPHLKKSESALYRELTNSAGFIWLARELDTEQALAISALKIPGIQKIKESRRIYPYKQVASQLLGFTNVDERGLSGIEHTFDVELHGKAGRARVQQDALGTKLMNVNYDVQKPEAGKDVILTIDYLYQSIVEEELRQSIQTFGADGGMVVMLQPQTGEILALASEPGFDCNHARSCEPGLWRNRAITDVYEPGSTFKIVLMTAILQEKLKNIQDKIFCENGSYRILDHEVKDHKGYGELPLGDVLVYSSNIGMAKLARGINREIFYTYARNFGFGNLTNIDLGGEIPGELKEPVFWSDYTPVAMAMGYEVAVTPLQLAMAYAAIANGGKLLQPQIIRQIGKDLKTVAPVRPEVIRQVLTPATAKMMRDLLQQAVERGTGTKARFDSLKICGKTGTAHKYAAEAKSYSSSEFLASFVGFFPAEHPEVLLCIMIDNPRTTYWGGEVAAPTFKKIVQRLVSIENRFWPQPQGFQLAQEKGNGKSQTVVNRLPDFTNRHWLHSQEVLMQLGIKAEMLNDGQVIAHQEPGPGAEIKKNEKVKFTLFQINESDSTEQAVPKVEGLSLREALNRLTLVNLPADIHGNGRVIRQIPAPGSRLKTGDRCVLECRPAIKPELFPTW